MSVKFHRVKQSDEQHGDYVAMAHALQSAIHQLAVATGKDLLVVLGIALQVSAALINADVHEHDRAEAADKMAEMVRSIILDGMPKALDS